MIPAPFEMSEFPVTNELFVLFDPTHATREREYNRKFSPEPQCPVINVSWYEAWCCSVWLGGFLPTEEEWEFACRAGATGTYYFPAHESLEDHAWHQDSSERTHPKGGKKANPWDLYDMLGNVAEWCDSRYYDPAILGQDRNRSGWRVFRGGSWHNPDFFCRCADRNADEPGIVLLGVGFRVSRVSRPS